MRPTPRALNQAKLQHAVNLLSQQLWCWGRDILRPEGNWLIELGFERITPPPDRSECPSTYTLNLPGGRHILLRGFGVFYGDPRYGGVFLHRYTFSPRFTAKPRLEKPPWSMDDLPMMGPPDKPDRPACQALTRDLVDWIAGYESDVADRLGLRYRDTTLREWQLTNGQSLPAMGYAGAWRDLTAQIEQDFHAYVKQAPAGDERQVLPRQAISRFRSRGRRLSIPRRKNSPRQRSAKTA